MICLVWLISMGVLPFSEEKQKGSGVRQRGGGRGLGGEEGGRNSDQVIKKTKRKEMHLPGL